MSVTVITSGEYHTVRSISSVAANATSSSEAIDVTPFVSCAVQVVWASHSDTSTFAIQTSIDGTNFNTISGSSTTTSGASGAATIAISNCPGRYIRFTITEADANASSTLTMYFIGRK